MKSILNRIWKSIQRPRLEFTKERLHRRPELFNRIQIRTIWWKINVSNTGAVQQISHCPCRVNCSSTGNGLPFVKSFAMVLSSPGGAGNLNSQFPSHTPKTGVILVQPPPAVKGQKLLFFRCLKWSVSDLNASPAGAVVQPVADGNHGAVLTGALQSIQNLSLIHISEPTRRS